MRNVLVLSALIFTALSALLYYHVPDAAMHFDVDSVAYDHSAQHFARTNELIDPVHPSHAPIQPVGYPFFVGLVYKLFGHHYAGIILMQVLLSLLAGWLLFCIASRMFGVTIAHIAVVLASLNIGLLVYAQFILAETLLVTVLLLFWDRLTAFLCDRKVINLLLSGLALGCSVLIKPMALLYICVLVPVLWFVIKQPRWRKVGQLLVLVVAWYIPIGGYMLRNYRMYGAFALAPMTSLNMYQCFLSKVIAYVHAVPAQEVIEKQLRFKGAHSLDEQGWHNAKKLFFYYLKRYPHVFIIVWLQNVFKTLVGLFSTQLKMLFSAGIKGGACSFFALSGTWWQRTYAYITFGSPYRIITIIALLEACWSVIRYLLAWLACIVLIKNRRYVLCTLMLAFIFLCAFMTGIDGCCRYRIVFEPLLIILAAFGSYVLYQWIVTFKIKRRVVIFGTQ